LNVARLRILLADDHEVVRRGIRSLLEAHPEWEVCAEGIKAGRKLAIQKGLDVRKAKRNTAGVSASRASRATSRRKA
jgi:DNA-binding NarL/FixJ family response regulator